MYFSSRRKHGGQSPGFSRQILTDNLIGRSTPVIGIPEPPIYNDGDMMMIMLMMMVIMVLTVVVVAAIVMTIIIKVCFCFLNRSVDNQCLIVSWPNWDSSCLTTIYLANTIKIRLKYHKVDNGDHAYVSLSSRA